MLTALPCSSACPVSAIERASFVISSSSVKIVGERWFEACHSASPAVAAKTGKADDLERRQPRRPARDGGHSDGTSAGRETASIWRRIRRQGTRASSHAEITAASLSSGAWAIVITTSLAAL